MHSTDPTPRPLAKIHGHSLIIVRVIAIGKLFKAACLLVIGTLILHHMKLHLDQSVHDGLVDFVNALRIDEHNHLIHGLLEKSLGISRETAKWFSIGTFIYSGLFILEGGGLLFDKPWAEWMVIVTTAGFIPLEIYEMCRELTLLKCLVFVLNVLILVYIVMRIRWRHLAKLEARARGFPVITRDTTPAGIKP